jgi:excisionase family DNA binding protein
MRGKKIDGSRPLTTGEVASLCHVTINAVKKWIGAGKIKAFATPGGHFRIKVEDLEVFLSNYNMALKDELYSRRMRILIADDEPDVVEFLKSALLAIDSDYEIETASDGYEALIKIGAFKPSLLILDIRMPRVDGFEVLKKLRENQRTKSTKVLAITAFGEEDAIKMIKAGANAYLTKPVQMKYLKEQVTLLLSR